MQFAKLLSDVVDSVASNLGLYHSNAVVIGVGNEILGTNPEGRDIGKVEVDRVIKNRAVVGATRGTWIAAWVSWGQRQVRTLEGPRRRPRPLR